MNRIAWIVVALAIAAVIIWGSFQEASAKAVASVFAGAGLRYEYVIAVVLIVFVAAAYYLMRNPLPRKQAGKR